jgi:hypothetical protein
MVHDPRVIEFDQQKQNVIEEPQGRPGPELPYSAFISRVVYIHSLPVFEVFGVELS